LARVTLPWLGKDVRPRPVADDSGLCEKAPAEPRLLASRAPRRRFLRWLFNGAAPEPLPSVRGPVEPAVEGKLGICCSGGGIRSAAFSLGALQVLQEEDELKRASYLAAVSGGSYIATAISMVNKTGDKDSDEELLKRMKPFEPGSPEEQYLRNRASYLAPGLTDKIYLGWRVVLGLLVNLMFIAVPLIGIALILGGLVYAPSLDQLAGSCGSGEASGCAVQPPLWFWLATLAPLGIGAAFGVATLLPRWRSVAWEQFFATWATRMLILAAAMAILLFAVPFAVEPIQDGYHFVGLDSDGAGLGAGTLALLAGVVAQLGHVLSSSQTTKELKGAQKLFSKLGKGARMAIAYLAAGLVGPLLLFGVFAFTVAAAMAETGTGGAVDPDLIKIGAGVLGGFVVLYFFSDITNWSLHPFYKRRLSTVFALKRVRASSLEPEEGDRVETVVPTDPATDVGIAVERDFDELVPISNTALMGGQGNEWPTLLICAAANISDQNATPPGRRVTSFTLSANTVGGPLVGAVPMWQLETAFESPEEAFPNIPPRALERKEDEAGALTKAVKLVTPSPARKRRGRDLTLAAAMAMSGAAISPSMGKMTRRPLTFLMALANVRLGVWVPNPRWVGELGRRQELRLRYVRPRPFYLLCELFGLNRIGSKYLYVTDGGHYENLGLVELLRRGCTEIYCLDASGVGAGGVEFEALGEAITLARSELAVEIEFDGEDGEKEEDDTSPAEMIPDKETHFAKRDVVAAKIKYRDGSEGRLVYVRNAMTETAPWDVRAHHEADPRFPNNPTIDQLYTDQKFEAYRVLGSRAAKRATKEMGVT
jgi:Patatin-like phospholipase